MKAIELQKIIASYPLGAMALAKELFPSHKYPSMALTRVIQGKAQLDAVQISKLALITGQSFNSLFGKEEWLTKSQNGKIIFTAGDYIAELDTDKWDSKVYHKDSLFHETVLHSTSIALSEYLHDLSELVAKHKNK